MPDLEDNSVKKPCVARFTVFLTDKQWCRFLFVGGVCFLANICVLFLGVDVFGFHYLEATLFSIGLTNTLGWWLNRNWTFEVLRVRDGLYREYLRYMLVNIGSFGVVFAGMAVLVTGFGLNYLFANTLISGVMAVFNFLAHRSWSFSTSKTGI